MYHFNRVWNFLPWLTTSRNKYQLPAAHINIVFITIPHFESNKVCHPHDCQQHLSNFFLIYYLDLDNIIYFGWVLHRTNTVNDINIFPGLLVEEDLAVYWCQRLITFGSSRMKIKPEQCWYMYNKSQTFIKQLQ